MEGWKGDKTCVRLLVIETLPYLSKDPEAGFWTSWKNELNPTSKSFRDQIPNSKYSIKKILTGMCIFMNIKNFDRIRNPARGFNVPDLMFFFI